MGLGRLSGVFLFSLILFLGSLTCYTLEVSGREEERKEDENDISERGEDPIWFLQISDLHLSIFSSPQNEDRDLRKFIAYLKKRINPEVFLITGDLTDAKTSSGFGSRQFLKEWELYQSIFRPHFNSTNFLDIRGNHDTFDVPNSRDARNFFQEFSIQGSKGNSRSYLKIHTRGKRKYGFIGVDATQVPGPKRPFNFVGIIDEDEFNKLQELEKRAKKECDYVFWFGHYPTSAVYSPRPGVRTLMSQTGFAYLCGHFHTFHNLVREMYAVHTNGLVELELGDWKDNRLFRILVVDEGRFSFADFRYNPKSENDPLIVIINPKDPSFVSPWKEPPNPIEEMREIRVLIFGNIASSEAVINNQNTLRVESKPCRCVKGPLFVCSWNPGSDFNSGVHVLTVKVFTADGRRFEKAQKFSFDGSGKSFSVVGRVLLTTHLILASQIISGFMTFGLFTLMYIGRLLHLKGCIPRWILRIPYHRFLLCCLEKVTALAVHDELFKPFACYLLYIFFGPWSFGYFLSDRLGILFAWGLFIDGTFLPADTTYIFIIFNFILCQLPMTFLMNHSLCRTRAVSGLLSFLYYEAGWIIFMAFQISQIFFFYSSYGLMAALGPIRLGTMILSVYFWVKSTTLSHRHICKKVYKP